MSDGGSRPQVVVVGSVMVDLVVYADPLPETGETVLGSAFAMGCGGKGANQAVTAHRLGADVTFVGRVGADPFGRRSLENLRELGMDASHVASVPEQTTGVAPIWVAGDGSNRIIVVPGANDALTRAAVEEELAGLKAADCLVCQLEIPSEAVSAALGEARRLGAIAVLNPAPARPELIGLFARADWVVPNEHEFALLWGAEPTDGAIIAAAEEWGCGLLVTLGAEGTAALVDGEVVRVTPPVVDVVDTTGAGDAFVGALACALATGEPVVAAIELGNRCAALSTQVRGTQVSFPSREAVETAGRVAAGRSGTVRA